MKAIERGTIIIEGQWWDAVPPPPPADEPFDFYDWYAFDDKNHDATGGRFGTEIKYTPYRSPHERAYKIAFALPFIALGALVLNLVWGLVQ